MLIRRGYHPPVGKEFVWFTVVITSALVAAFVVIDAFSLGVRNLPPTQLLNQHVLRPSSSSSSSHLVLKGAIDDDTGINYDSSGDSPFFAKLDEDSETGDVSNNGSHSPFFSELENDFEMNGEVPFLEKWVGGYESFKDLKKFAKSDGDMASPFFAKKEEPLQIDKESLISDESDFTELLKKVDSTISDSSSPFFAKKEEKRQIDEESFLLDKTESNEARKEVDNSRGRDLPSLFFAKKDESESNDKQKKVDLPSLFIAKKEDQLQIDREPPISKQQLQEQQVAENESNQEVEKIETQTTNGKRSLRQSSFAPIDRVVRQNKVARDSTEEIANPNAWIPESVFKPVKIEAFKDIIDPSEVLSKEKLLKVIKDIPSKVEETVENSEKLLKDVQDVTRKVNKSLQTTKQAVEKTVEITQETVKEVQILSNKVKQSLEETKQIVEENVEKTQLLSNKVKESLEVTKKTMEEKVEKTQETVNEVKDFSRKIAESEAGSKAKVLLQLEPPSTLEEEALDLAGKATITAAKLALWATKNVGILALKGSQSLYDNTIGPEVEEVWNESVESLNSSVEKVTGTLNTSVERVKNTPLKVKSAVTESLKKVTNIRPDSALKKDIADAITDLSSTSAHSVSSSAKNKKQPAFVSRKDVIVDSEDDQMIQEATRERNIPVSVKKIISKSPEELNKELDEAEKLAREVADALAMAERALNADSSIELNEPMVEIENKEPIERVEATLLPSNSNFEKKRRLKLDMYKYLSRVKLPVFEPVTPDFETAKSKADLDAELEKAESLVKEISDALDSAEQAMSTKSEKIKSIEKKIEVMTQIDEMAKNTTTI